MFLFHSLKLTLVIKHHLMHVLIHIEIWLVEKIRIQSIFFFIKHFLIIIELIKLPFVIFIFFRIFNKFSFHIINNLLMIESGFDILINE
jgi:hypothetical protein